MISIIKQLWQGHLWDRFDRFKETKGLNFILDSVGAISQQTLVTRGFLKVENPWSQIPNVAFVRKKHYSIERPVRMRYILISKLNLNTFSQISFKILWPTTKKYSDKNIMSFKSLDKQLVQHIGDFIHMAPAKSL